MLRELTCNEIAAVSGADRHDHNVVIIDPVAAVGTAFSLARTMDSREFTSVFVVTGMLAGGGGAAVLGYGAAGGGLAGAAGAVGGGILGGVAGGFVGKGVSGVMIGMYDFVMA